MLWSRIRPRSLQEGEMYTFDLNQAMPGSTPFALLIGSHGQGALIDLGTSFSSDSDMTDVSYEKLGSHAARIQLVDTNAVGGLSTNTCTLVYLNAEGGWVEWDDGGAITTLGTFRRETSMIGKALAPIEPQPGETFSLVLNDGLTTQPLCSLSTPLQERCLPAWVPQRRAGSRKPK